MKCKPGLAQGWEGKGQMKTKAEERLILAALRFKKQIWNNGDGVCRAAIAVIKEREKK